jgi:hypothetical protein
MKTIIILLILSLVPLATFANSDRTIILSKEKKQAIEKIKYYEYKLFKSSNENNIRQINLKYQAKESTLLQRIIPAQRYVSYNLSQPASPFLIMVIPFENSK